jgi:hypothetical protein
MTSTAGLAGVSHAAAPAAANVMALGSPYPNITRGLNLIKSSDAELAAYLANPKSVCTFFAPSNTAMTDSIRRLGKYAGIAAQNESMQTATFNYHGKHHQLQHITLHCMLWCPWQHANWILVNL